MRELKEIVKLELDADVYLAILGGWKAGFYCSVSDGFQICEVQIEKEEYERLKRDGFIPEIFFKYFAITFCKNELIVYEKDNYIEELYASFDVTEEEKKEIRKYARHYNSGR